MYNTMHKFEVPSPVNFTCGYTPVTTPQIKIESISVISRGSLRPFLVSSP